MASRIKAHWVKYGQRQLDKVDPMRTSVGLLITATALLAASCSVQTVPAAPVDDAQLVLGEQIWTGSCIACHGRQGQGGRGGRLNEGRVLLRYADPADQIDLINNGKGAMPAFSSKLSQEQIEAVVAYTRQVL